MKRACLMCLVLSVAAARVLADETELVDLSKIDRRIAREPNYAHEPHYALVVFGPRAAHRSWLVMDGDDVLYFDRNGNGDLTDPEDRIALDVEGLKKATRQEDSPYAPSHEFAIGTVAGVDLRFDFWVRKRGFVPKDERYRKLMQERRDNNWENGTLWRITGPIGRAQNPTLLCARPADAQITHLDGPLTFGLKRHAKQKLQHWPRE